MAVKPTLLIYRLGSLGDTVVALPCFHAIRRAFPDHRRVVLTNVPVSSKAAPLGSILIDGGFVHETVAYPVGIRHPLEFYQLNRELRSRKAETLIYMMGSRGMISVVRDLAFFRLCGIKKIIGAPFSRADDYGRTLPSGDVEPEAERLARTLQQLGPIDLRIPESWDLCLTKVERASADDFLRPLGRVPFIAVNMGGKAAEKDWGEARWAQFLQALSSRAAGNALLFVGAAEDSARASRLATAWSGPTLDACGRLTPRESGAVLSRAGLFIGHDSGPLHLAAAMQVPCVGLFGGFNRPAKWHPYGQGHLVLHEMRGMEHIAVRQVLEAAGQLLMRHAPIDAATA